MYQQIINQVVNYSEGIAITAILAILSYVAKGAGQIAIEFLKAKKQAVIATIGNDQYNFYRGIALDVYNRVEEEFRGQIGVSMLKSQAFDKYLLERIPGLTQEQIDHFRQSVVGYVNNVVKESNILDSATEVAVENQSEKVDSVSLDDNACMGTNEKTILEANQSGETANTVNISIPVSTNTGQTIAQETSNQASQSNVTQNIISQLSPQEALNQIHEIVKSVEIN
ncbi:hypothetical protein D2A34_14175 [Clostridium chromiireducens]|uniref:Uncharacterized protein n=1 Tax=Clostridium chromiireducens TaxID=225345 RepID=A0A399IML8_9CLOT|nr:hypothetical protein [Clostridium chromiireducens]RII34293.1 hypothetical protein D2A34_14175 [Clostridium chromiireducens]